MARSPGSTLPRRRKADGIPEGHIAISCKAHKDLAEAWILLRQLCVTLNCNNMGHLSDFQKGLIQQADDLPMIAGCCGKCEKSKESCKEK
ncbi:MAG: hypothetical protein KAJ73_00670 [Zetaproteobacteria bacterium]|nr:hypothetical protein [Zetaproteobacteria bacterium]